MNTRAASPRRGIIESDSHLTELVLARMAQASDPRLREIMASLVRHAHAFVREVRLTEAEFEHGVDFLNRIGQSTHDVHNEGMLFSDAIGVSTLVCLLNNGQGGATETASALLGPFWRLHSPPTVDGGSIVRSPTPGPALFVRCRVVDSEGGPLAGVEVDVWQASPIGLYENQDSDQADMNLRGKFVTGDDGAFSFSSVKPAGYPVPIDGPVGEMLGAQNRHPHRPAHLHFLAFKPGYKTLITQIFTNDDKYLESDVVFGVTRDLIGDYRLGIGPAPAPEMVGPWYSLNHRLMMERGEARLPRPPIK